MIIRRRLGDVGVDSGQLFIIDPCYLIDREGDETLDRAWYEKICQETCDNTEVASGVKLANFGGDGTFPVYGTFDRRSDGEELLLRVEIILDYSEEDHEEEELE